MDKCNEDYRTCGHCNAAFDIKLKCYKVNKDNPVIFDVKDCPNAKYPMPKKCLDGDIPKIESYAAFYDSSMDEGTAELCDALNSMPGIITSESCNGHCNYPASVWFSCNDFSSLAILSRIIDRRYRVTEQIWHLECKFTDTLPGNGMPPLVFRFYSEEAYPSIEEFKKDVKRMAAATLYYRESFWSDYFDGVSEPKGMVPDDIWNRFDNRLNEIDAAK